MLEEVNLLSVEAYIDFLLEAQSRNAINVPGYSKRSDQEYEESKNKIEYWQYALYADMHYFIARVLWVSKIEHYAKFCAYQAIENYLKAFIKLKGGSFKDTHDLYQLRRMCQELDSSNTFFHGTRMTLCIDMYRPFYEITRYPIGRKYPGESYSWNTYDIFVLDYFVFKIREFFPKSETNNSDLLQGGHFWLQQHLDSGLSLNDRFKHENINVTKPSV